MNTINPKVAQNQNNPSGAEISGTQYIVDPKASYLDKQKKLDKYLEKLNLKEGRQKRILENLIGNHGNRIKSIEVIGGDWVKVKYQYLDQEIEITIKENGETSESFKGTGETNKDYYSLTQTDIRGYSVTTNIAKTLDKTAHRFIDGMSYYTNVLDNEFLDSNKVARAGDYTVSFYLNANFKKGLDAFKNDSNNSSWKYIDNWEMFFEDPSLRSTNPQEADKQLANNNKSVGFRQKEDDPRTIEIFNLKSSEGKNDKGSQQYKSLGSININNGSYTPPPKEKFLGIF